MGIKEGGKRRIAVRPERGWKSDKANCGAAIDVGTALGVPGASVTEVPRPPSCRLRSAWRLRTHVCCPVGSPARQQAPARSAGSLGSAHEGGRLHGHLQGPCADDLPGSCPLRASGVGGERLRERESASSAL